MQGREDAGRPAAARAFDHARQQHRHQRRRQTDAEQCREVERDRRVDAFVGCARAGGVQRLREPAARAEIDA